jgi:hypothetical protein
MKQKEVFKKIGGIIQELNEQYEYLQTVSDNLNDLELELFVANAHFLTDHIEILCKLNLQNKPKRPLIEKPEIYQQKFFEPVVQQMKPGADLKEAKTREALPKPLETEINKEPEKAIKPIEIEVTNQEAKPKKTVNPAEIEVTDEATTPERQDEDPVIQYEQPEEHAVPQFDFTSQAPEDTYSFIREEPETIRHELVLDEADTWEDDAEDPVEEPIENEIPAITENTNILPGNEPAQEVKEDIQPITEKREEQPVTKYSAKDEEAEIVTRNQKISSLQGDKASKSEQLGIKPISDIKLAITLNDKLLYVKDLFNGYNLAYSEAIEILNRFNTFEEAQRFLKTNYVTKNNWESKQATADKFYALLKRRYV